MVTKENQRFLLVYKVMNDIVAINQFRGEFFGNFIPKQEAFRRTSVRGNFKTAPDKKTPTLISCHLLIHQHNLGRYY
jgi:hypothetical protein